MGQKHSGTTGLELDLLSSLLDSRSPVQIEASLCGAEQVNPVGNALECKVFCGNDS